MPESQKRYTVIINWNLAIKRLNPDVHTKWIHKYKYYHHHILELQ